jgi:hypothetical protein
MADRFFVTIRASDEQQFRRLFEYDLDLFASRKDEGRFEIDGLITLDDVSRLVESGYQVLVAETDTPKRDRPGVARPDEWLREVEADLEPGGRNRAD